MTEYSTTTENASDDLTITLEAESATAKVELNGTEVEGNDGTYTLTWAADPNEVEITVTDTGAAGEESKCYTITVTAPVTGVSDVDTNSDEVLSQEELEALTVAQLKQLAASLEIALTATRKAEIIAEILAAQEENNETPDAPGD